MVAADGGTRCLLSVLAGATMIPEVMQATGRNKSTVHNHLRTLRSQGLIDFEDYRRGTLRPLVAPVDISGLRLAPTPASDEEPNPCESS